MAMSSDAGHFFQTTAALEDIARKETKKKNDRGKPIKLTSKILAVISNPRDANSIYIAEAAGTVKHVNIESREVDSTLRPNTLVLAPLTCLAATETTVYAGSWDKNIYAWAASSGRSERKFSGHADFVKALLCTQVDSSTLLVSCSADTTIIVWDATNGAKLHILKGHTRGVTALVLEDIDTAHDGSTYATIFSGDSSREIRRWAISPAASYELSTSGTDRGAPSPGPTDPLIAHETSLYALKFDSDLDLWTASADKTAKCLSRDHAWQTDTTLQHPDFVRDIIISEQFGYVVTACRDENVRIWEKGSGKLVHVYEGHYEEVTGLSLLANGDVVSVSIDGTVRTWGLKPQDIQESKEEAELASTEAVKEDVKKKSVLTEEEEAELAELMDSDED